MNWVFLSLLSALGQAATDMTTTKTVRKIDEYATSWALYFYSMLLVAPLWFFVKTPEIDPRFFIVLPVVAILDTMGVLLYVKALKHSDLSLSLPIQMFTPLFLLISSPLILGEPPTLLGIVGVIMIIGGSYVLNSRSGAEGLFSPVRAIFKETGPRCMFAGSIIWSITCTLHKLGVTYSAPITYAVAHRCAVCAMLGLCLLVTRRKRFVTAINRSIIRNYQTFLLIAALSSVTMLSQLAAMEVGNVVYVTAIKRMSVVFGVLVGAVVFKEFGLRQRLAGACIMVAGVFCTTF